MPAKNAKKFFSAIIFLILSARPFDPCFSPRDAERGLSDRAN
jgi:hypothetical protein